MEISTDAIVSALEREKLVAEVPKNLPGRIQDLTDDSRRIISGSLFIAIKGADADGHSFLAAAERAGATAAIVERKGPISIPQIIVRDGRRAAAIAAATAFGMPADKLSLVGITGTNGKTTVAVILRHLLAARGRSASIGTIGTSIDDGSTISGPDLTTPGPIDLQRTLAALVRAGVRSVAMEVSSHSLDQNRVDGLRFDAGVFTNVTRDHLDYHKTMERYVAAKLSLLNYLKPDGAAIVNADDAAWSGIRTKRRITYSVGNDADVTARKIAYTSSGSEWTLSVGNQSETVRLPLLGDFNISNALAAAAAAWACGIDVGTIAERLNASPQVPGRFEIIASAPTVLRDYAHTPDALERALKTLAAVKKGRLIALFGCGGNRDKGKRPLMGAIAERLADLVIVTSDNPRTETPERIIDDILAGMKRSNHETIVDRKEAIARALALAKEEDLIVLAGKGHETYQVRGTEKFPFDEREIVNELLSAAK